MRLGLVDSGGVGEILVGSALLLLGGALTAALVQLGRKSPAQGYLTYGVTVLWALLGIVANKYDASLVTTAAMVATVPVVLAHFGAFRGGRSRPGAGPAARPGMT